MNIHAKTLRLVIICSSLITIAGCQQKERDTLSYDQNLSNVVSVALKDRASNLDVTALSLRCSRDGGPLHASVSYRYGGSEHKKTVASMTACTTKGKLLDVDFSEYSSIRVTSNDAYASDMVLSELDMALTKVFGTLALDIPGSIKVSQKHQKQLGDMNMLHVDFACDIKKQRVSYDGYYRGGKRKGVLTKTCPTTMDKSPILARLSHDNTEKPGYNLLVTSTTSSEQAQDFLADFFRIAGARQSF